MVFIVVRGQCSERHVDKGDRPTSSGHRGGIFTIFLQHACVNSICGSGGPIFFQNISFAHSWITVSLFISGFGALVLWGYIVTVIAGDDA